LISITLKNKQLKFLKIFRKNKNFFIYTTKNKFHLLNVACIQNFHFEKKDKFSIKKFLTFFPRDKTPKLIKFLKKFKKLNYKIKFFKKIFNYYLKNEKINFFTSYDEMDNEVVKEKKSEVPKRKRFTIKNGKKYYYVDKKVVLQKLKEMKYYNFKKKVKIMIYIF